MKTFQMKTLVAALALAGLATACDRDSAQQDAYVAPEPAAVDQSTTAPGTTDPSALRSLEKDGYAHQADLNRTGNITEADHEGTLQFSGTELTPESEGELQTLVESLDKQKPIKVIVAMDDDMYENDAGQQTPTASQQTDVSLDSRTRYTSAFGQRVDTVKQFMQEQGVEVTHWQFERMEEQDLAQQEDAQEDAQDVQSVRLVILGSSEDNGISAVSED